MTRKILFLFFLGTLAATCPAQQPVHHHAKPAAAPAAPAAPATPAPTDKIKVDKITYTGTGAGDYSASDFATVTGLAPGTIVYSDIQAGADTLANSGQFGNVDFAMDGTTLVYKIMAAPQALPVHFENFPWWSEVDLLRDIHAKFPLFVGALGGKGTLQQNIQDTLAAMVTEKAGEPAKVDMTMLAKPGQRAYAVAFTITSPTIKVGEVDIHGSMAVSTLIAEISQQMEGRPYNRDRDREELTSSLREAYGANGYIDFVLKDFEAVNPRRSGSGGFVVTLRGTPEPGQLYHIASIVWTETPQFSQAQFDVTNTLKAGDVASLGPLQLTLHNIERAYQAQGYVNAKATATPTLDHEHGTVSYVISVEPGTIFHTDGM
jgi:outer membrane protein assembly factor BamA